MLLKVGTQVSNTLKITLTKFHQHLSTGSQVFKGWDNNRRLTTPKEFSRLCYRPHREITRCGQKLRSIGVQGLHILCILSPNSTFSPMTQLLPMMEFPTTDFAPIFVPFPTTVLRLRTAWGPNDTSLDRYTQPWPYRHFEDILPRTMSQLSISNELSI